MTPFLVFARQIDALSAVRRVARGGSVGKELVLVPQANVTLSKGCRALLYDTSSDGPPPPDANSVAPALFLRVSGQRRAIQWNISAVGDANSLAHALISWRGRANDELSNVTQGRRSVRRGCLPRKITRR